MFERLTDRARGVVVAAQEQARLLRHNYIGTEHLLLGLLNEGGSVAAAALQSFGISQEETRHRIEMIVGLGVQSPVERLPFTPRAKKVLELSLRVALEAGNNYIGTEHILLGLIREGEGMGAQILARQGVELDLLSQKVIQILSGSLTVPSGPLSVPSAGVAPEAETSDTTLSITAMEGKPFVPEGSAHRDDDHGSRDLARAARLGWLDPVVGREWELNRILQVLTRRTRNNPVLVGGPGVGKTAVVNALAQRIADGAVPDVFKDQTLYVVDLRAETESGLREVLAEGRKHDRGPLLFVENLENVFGTQMPLAALIQQMVGSREIRLISTSSSEGFQRVIRGDQRLLSVLQDVTLAAPDAAGAVQMVKAGRDRFEAYHRVSITDAALVEAVRMGERYIHDRRLPASAIDLIDEAGARLRINQGTEPPGLRDAEGAAEVGDAEVREVVEQMLKERIDNESAAPTAPDEQGAADRVFPAGDVWMMA
jgi:ATP-dependent Clp protease ATP-binding subunit ClpC